MNDKNYKGWPHLMISGFQCDKKSLNDDAKIYSLLKTYLVK